MHGSVDTYLLQRDAHILTIYVYIAKYVKWEDNDDKYKNFSVNKYPNGKIVEVYVKRRNAAHTLYILTEVR